MTDVVPEALFVAEYFLSKSNFGARSRTDFFHDLVKFNKQFLVTINIHSFSEAPLHSIKK